MYSKGQSLLDSSVSPCSLLTDPGCFSRGPASRFQTRFLYIMFLKTESLSCWPQFSLKSSNILSLSLWPGEHMYFHNDQKIERDRELARTICTEFFSVRRAPWRPLFIYHVGVCRATADKCTTMLSLYVTRLSGHSIKTNHGSPCLCSPSHPRPSKPVLGQHMGAIWAHSFLSNVQVTWTMGDLQRPQMECSVCF